METEPVRLHFVIIALLLWQKISSDGVRWKDGWRCVVVGVQFPRKVYMFTREDNDLGETLITNDLKVTGLNTSK